MAKRVQRKRAKGWRMPPNTVYVGRGSKWGNPFKVGDPGVPDNETACRKYEEALHDGALGYTIADARRELEGKNLACWCRLDEPCHADMLLREANGDRKKTWNSLSKRLRTSAPHSAPAGEGRGMPKIILADNMDILPDIPGGTVNLIYIDPPFNTGKVQSRTRIKTMKDENGDRTGFQGKRYKTIPMSTSAYSDAFDDYPAFMEPRLKEAHRILAEDGSLFFHIDYREVHYCKVLLDAIFGRDCFMNEIIWAYDYGARSRKKWSAKHDNILWYAKDPKNYTFNYDEMDRIPYMAPGLVGKEKAAKGKTPTDVWWHTIVSPNGREKTGYATQKPLGIIDRIVKVHSRPGDLLMDFFAGSGTLGEAAAKNGRDFILVDNNPEAAQVMARRFTKQRGAIEWLGYNPDKEKPLSVKVKAPVRGTTNKARLQLPKAVKEEKASVRERTTVEICDWMEWLMLWQKGASTREGSEKERGKS